MNNNPNNIELGDLVLCSLSGETGIATLRIEHFGEFIRFGIAKASANNTPPEFAFEGAAGIEVLEKQVVEPIPIEPVNIRPGNKVEDELVKVTGNISEIYYDIHGDVSVCIKTGNSEYPEHYTDFGALRLINEGVPHNSNHDTHRQQ